MEWALQGCRQARAVFPRQTVPHPQPRETDRKGELTEEEGGVKCEDSSYLRNSGCTLTFSHAVFFMSSKENAKFVPAKVTNTICVVPRVWEHHLIR